MLKVNHNLISPKHRQELETDPIPVFCIYDRQNQPQDAYIEIDPSSDYPVRATYNPNIGSGMSAHYYHNHEIHISIPCQSSGKSILKFIDRYADHFQAIVDGYDSEWDGSNMVGKWTENAGDSIDFLERQAEDEMEIQFIYWTIDDLGIDYEIDLGTDPEQYAQELLDNLEAEEQYPYFDKDDLVKHIKERQERIREEQEWKETV